MKRKLIALLASVALIATGTITASADENYGYPSRSKSVPFDAYRMTISEQEPDHVLHMSYSPFDATNGATMNSFLANQFPTVLTPCDNAAEVGCIETVSAFVAGNWVDAKFNQFLPIDTNSMTIVDGAPKAFHRINWDADPSKGLFASNEPLLWSLPEAPNKLGNFYTVNAVVQSMLVKGVAVMTGIDIDAWAVDQTGKRAVNLPEDLNLKVSVRLGKRINELNGWFDGRIADAQIDLGKTNPGVLTISGKPVWVSTIATEDIPIAEVLTPEELARWRADQKLYGTTEGFGGLQWSRNGYSNYIRYLKHFKDRAETTNTYWRMSSWQGASTPQCPTVAGVKGIVITNASAYDMSPPQWQPATQSLKFSVASSHYLEDGKLNTGYYRLLVSEGVAKCLWGKSATNAKASISVTSNDGSAEVATTAAGTQNGWFFFDALGYHYSAPTISVKLNTTATTPALTTIACVNIKNPKVIKWIASVSPKCPTGYKKKS